MPLHLALKGPLPLELRGRVAVVEAELVIVRLPLLVVDEGGVSFLDLHELIVGLGIVLVEVGVVLHAQPKPGLSDLRLSALGVNL